VYSLEVTPAPRIKSVSSCRGRSFKSHIVVRHSASSAGESGSTLATVEP
jgi:hypothetical protein